MLDRADRRPAARRACSTSSTASASRRASRWRPAAAIAQDRLHRRDDDRPADHAVRQRRTSSRSPWSSAARARTSSSTTSPPSRTPSTTRPSRASRCSPSTRARSAPARRGRWSRARSTATSCGDAVARVEKIKQGNPLDTDTMIGAQASNDQLEKILSYIDIGRQEGAKVLTGGERNVLDGDLAERLLRRSRPIFEGDNSMRIFQEEIFGPVVVADRLRRRGRRPQDRQRHPLRPRRRRVDPRRLTRLPDGPRHPGRPGVDELLPRRTRRTPRSAATSSPASAARTTR